MAKEEINTLRNMLPLEPLLRNTLDNATLSLSGDQNYILVAERMFVKAYNDTMWDYRENYEQAMISIEELKDTALESIATEQGIARVSDIVFKNDVVRELVLNIQTRFIVSFSDYNDKWNNVLRLLTLTLTHTPIGVAVEVNKYMVPKDITDRIYSQSMLFSIFQNNMWLVMVLFIKLWVKTKSFEELRLKYKEGQANGVANPRSN